MRPARVLRLQPQSLAPRPNLHLNAAVTTAAHIIMFVMLDMRPAEH